MRYIVSLVAVLLALPALSADPSKEALLALHQREAAAYRIWSGAEKSRQLTLNKKPVLSWTNPVGEGIQYGHIFVWMLDGRPQAIGTIFSFNQGNAERIIVHEFHTLAIERLVPETPATSAESWVPQLGIGLESIPNAPEVAASPVQRLRQMRSLARGYQARSISPDDGSPQELRLLSQPLVRYQPDQGLVTDGAIFALVSSDGTDPEVLLMIEARRLSKEAAPRWQATALRFSERHLQVNRGTSVVYDSQADDSLRCRIEKAYTLMYVPDRTYMCYRAQVIPEIQ